MPTFPTILILNNYGQITVVFVTLRIFLASTDFFAHRRGKNRMQNINFLTVARKICTFQIFGAHA